MRLTAALVLVLPIAGILSPQASSKDSAHDRAREVIVQALAQGGDVPGQAQNLVGLAWPAGKRDELVSALARRELVNFGENSIAVLRRALNTVKTEYTEEVLDTTLRAQRNVPGGMAMEYLASVVDALWIGSHGAKVLAIQSLQGGRAPVVVAPMIDSAIDDPTLAPLVVETLGALHYQQARFYLEKVMMEGPGDLRPVAASSLAQIGGLSLLPLKNALKAPSRDARLLAARSLLPVATEYDLGALYEYIEKHGDDDPVLTQELKSQSVRIEKAIAARDAREAAASPQNF